MMNRFQNFAFNVNLRRYTEAARPVYDSSASRPSVVGARMSGASAVRPTEATTMEVIRGGRACRIMPVTSHL